MARAVKSVHVKFCGKMCLPGVVNIVNACVNKLYDHGLVYLEGFTFKSLLKRFRRIFFTTFLPSTNSPTNSETKLYGD